MTEDPQVNSHEQPRCEELPKGAARVLICTDGTCALPLIEMERHRFCKENVTFTLPHELESRLVHIWDVIVLCIDSRAKESICLHTIRDRSDAKICTLLPPSPVSYSDVSAYTTMDALLAGVGSILTNITTKQPELPLALINRNSLTHA